VVAALLFFSLARVQTGAYGISELCSALAVATGTPHVADVIFDDYAVFVGVKSGDPARVEKLVATAFHAEWVDAGGRQKLKLVKPAKDEDFPEFQRLYKLACHDSKYSKLPLHDLYKLAPGELARYSPDSSPYANPLPPALSKPPEEGEKQNLTIMRLAEGVFCFGKSDQIQFKGLPDAVKQVLGSDLAKDPLTDEQKASHNKAASDPHALKIDWSQIEKRDPVASMQESMLDAVAATISADLVMALPDFTLFATLQTIEAHTTVESVLDTYTGGLMWTTVDGAVIAQLNGYYLDRQSQAKRSVLRKVMGDVSKSGVADVSTLSEYVDQQRPAASDGWMDTMLLVTAGVVLDQEYVGDYPQNMRMYVRFDKDDWAKLRSGQPFAASDLSPHAREELLNLLIQSHNRIDTDASDPAYWQTLDPSQLTIRPKIEEKSILIGFTQIGGEVGSVSELAGNYEWRRKDLGHEPLYQPAVQTKLTLTISSPAEGEKVTTGFSAIAPSKTQPVVWNQLPKEVAAEFKKIVNSTHVQQNGQVGKPPPK
jgi:hypothetical protein